MHSANVPYQPAHGRRGLLDLDGPDDATGRSVVIVIHGGGLRDFSKERMANLAVFLMRSGYVTANINYRVLPESRYPAPLEDTLAAIEWVRSASHPYLAAQERRRVALLGASAGGFLALIAGFLLGPGRIAGIVSISGPTLPGRYGPGETTNPRMNLAPIDLVNVEAPPVLAIHSRNDELVDIAESRALIGALHEIGTAAELHEFDGPGRLHGIWGEESAVPCLEGHLKAPITAFLHRVLFVAPNTNRTEGDPK